MNFILKWTIGLKAKKANKTVRHFSHCSLALFFPTKKALPKAMAALTFCLQWNPHTHTDIYTHMQRQSSPGWAALDGHTGLSCLCEDSSCSPWKEALHGGREVKKKADSLFLSLPPKFRALDSCSALRRFTEEKAVLFLERCLLDVPLTLCMAALNSHKRTHWAIMGL